MAAAAHADHRLAQHPSSKHLLHHQTVLPAFWKRLADLWRSLRRVPRW
jgi:hypothetical protein